MNSVIVCGNLGKDAEVKYTPSGVARVTFSLATTRRVKKDEEWQDYTTWHNIVAWRKENLANYLTKGKKVLVRGYIDNRSYDDKNGEKKYVSEIVADEVELLGGKNEGNGGERQERQQQKPQAQSQGDSYDWPEDDTVPF